MGCARMMTVMDEESLDAYGGRVVDAGTSALAGRVKRDEGHDYTA